MKKNMLTVVILAISVLNLVLSALIVFTVVPASNRTNKLVSQVASAVDLELANEGKTPNVSMDNTETYTITQEQTINLTVGADGQPHYALCDTITISMNSKAKDYKKVSANMAKGEGFIIDTISEVVSQYTSETVGENRDKIKAECLEEICKHFDTDCIYDISFGNLRFQ